jgi:hypothetical protein
MVVKSKVDHSALSGGEKLPPAPAPGDGAAAVLDKFAPMPAPAAPEIINGRQITPPRILLYGTEGIGKSTIAAKAERPIFVQTEDGLGQIDCERFALSTTYEDAVEKLRYVAQGEHPYQTVVIDSVDWLERLIWANVCRRNNSINIEKVGGGFAKGYAFALDEWKEIIDLLARCHSRGMAVILLAHSKIERFEDPESPAYDRYSPRLHKHAQAMLTEWVDAVLFATRKMTVRTEGAGFNERGVAVPVGAAGGERIIRTVGSPACVAKNRYSMPPELPLAWDAIVASLAVFMNQPKGA